MRTQAACWRSSSARDAWSCGGRGVDQSSTSVSCPRCGWTNEVFRPRTKVKMSEAECPTCHAPARPEIVGSVDEGTPLADRSLAGLGVPAYDIVRVDGPGGTGFFLLAGDRPAAMGV